MRARYFPCGVVLLFVGVYAARKIKEEDVGYFANRKHELYNQDNFTKFFQNLGWNNELMSELEKAGSSLFMKIDFNEGKWNATFKAGSRSRKLVNIEFDKEFQETLFDGRKAKSILLPNISDEDWEVWGMKRFIWTQKVVGGPIITHHVQYIGDSWSGITTTVEGNKESVYVEMSWCEESCPDSTFN